MDYVVDREFIVRRYAQLVAPFSDDVNVVGSANVSAYTRATFERLLPWSLVIVLLYYPLVLLIDAKRDRAACGEFRKRNAWLVHLWAGWNVVLALLSMVGVYPIDGALLRTALAAWRAGTPWFCALDAYGEFGVADAMFWFVVSKYAELLDTAFLLLLSSQPVAFLHSFHHVCTLAYCLYASIHLETLSGHSNALFGGMNVFVHSIMYLYYAAQISPLTADGPLRSVLRRISPLITTLQLVQMICGVTFAFWSFVACPNSVARLSLPALLMYAIYFREFYVLLMSRDVSKKLAASPAAAGAKSGAKTSATASSTSSTSSKKEL